MANAGSGTKRRKSVPAFANQREFNYFYAIHCWECRDPLPSFTSRECVRTWEENPDIGFMMYCDTCKARLERQQGAKRSIR
jgi:hypothetical protein